jgi:hypothetical protein
MRFAWEIAIQSRYLVLKFLIKKNVWRTNLHAKINAETAIVTNAEINALINTITAVLFWVIAIVSL